MLHNKTYYNRMLNWLYIYTVSPKNVTLFALAIIPLNGLG